MADIFNPCQTLVQLTNFLTRPLIRAYPITTVIHLQLALQRHFQASSFFVDSIVPSPFTLLLSRNSLPPTPIFAACLMSGIQWKDWIHLLTRGINHEICIFVMDGLIEAQAGGPSQSVDREGAKFQGSAVTVWAASGSGTVSTPMLGLDRSKTERPTVAKLRAVLDSVRSRSRGLGAPASNIIAHKDTPAPSIFLSPPTATFSVESTPQAVVSTNDDAGLSDSDSDLEDSDSDADSFISSTSSRLSAFSSTESVTSIATSVSCASSAKLKIPTDSLLIAMANSKHPSPLSAPISSSPSTSSSHVQTSQKPSTQSSQTSASSDPKTTCSERDRPGVTVDHSKNEITRYTYQGGQTGVITGGVMLGTGLKSSLTPSPSAKSPSSSEHASLFKGPGFSFPGAGGKGAGEMVTTAKSALLTRGKGSYNAGNCQLKGTKTHKRGSDSADWRSKAQ
ncbi:serine-rich protein [Moniliophthora roreri]|uniref:Uncharacterized protein n=1 Tax=Moniliophthora roreri TaxID=221103 RepID=A0A0W0FC21_MONRR|nr:serine-rich protein [Moniliophthora roreri]